MKSIGAAAFAFTALAFAVVACGDEPAAKDPSTVASATPPVASTPPAPPPPPPACAPDTMRPPSGGDCVAIVACTVGDQADCETKCAAGNAKSCDNAATHVKRGNDHAKAYQLFQRACDLGYMEACDNAGAAAFMRPDVPREDSAKVAQADFEKACAAGIGQGCERAAFHYQIGGAKDPDKAIALLEKACSASPTSCGALARAYLKFKTDPVKAQDAADRGCNASSERTGYVCREWGEYLEVGGDGLTKDPAKALGYFQKGCDKKDGLSCHDLGIAYKDGIGTAKDATKAHDAYAKTCTKEQKWHGMTCVALGEATEAKDPAAAFEIYNDTCEEKQGLGCLKAAQLLEKGAKGVTKDAAKANEQYKKACEHIRHIGDDAALVSLRNACDKAEADEEKKDKAKATSFWQDRCEKHNDSHACAKWKSLGGTIPDEKLHARLGADERMCKRGSPEACKLWKELGGTPTPDQLKQPVVPWRERPPSQEDGLTPNAPAAPGGAKPAPATAPAGGPAKPPAPAGTNGPPLKK